jgi:hypothetical protein
MALSPLVTFEPLPAPFVGHEYASAKKGKLSGLASLLLFI